MVLLMSTSGVVKYWLMPWLGYHFWMSTFTVVHHTAPHIPFKPAEEWNAAKAQLSGAWATDVTTKRQCCTDRAAAVLHIPVEADMHCNPGAFAGSQCAPLYGMIK
jgi:hypothetical protein